MYTEACMQNASEKMVETHYDSLCRYSWSERV